MVGAVGQGGGASALSKVRAATRGTTRTDNEFDDAFQALFLAAFRLAARMTGDRAAAEDIAAEALVRAFAQWAKVRELPHRDAWVMRVASNLALDSIRRRAPARRAVERLAPASGAAAESSDETALRLALADALRQLPSRQRDAVVLRYLVGMDDASVAEALGMAGSTVRTHVQRGLAALRRRLATDLEDLGFVAD